MANCFSMQYLQRCFKHKCVTKTRIPNPATFQLKIGNGYIVLKELRSYRFKSPKLTCGFSAAYQTTRMFVTTMTRDYPELVVIEREGANCVCLVATQVPDPINAIALHFQRKQLQLFLLVYKRCAHFHFAVLKYLRMENIL